LGRQLAIEFATLRYSEKLQMTEAVTKENLSLIGDMSGHPAMSEYIEKGYTILTF
jgi:hypothetical protein